MTANHPQFYSKSSRATMSLRIVVHA